MSPKSKTRKKKTRPREERSPYAPLLASAAALLDLESQLEAELWASELFGSLWLGAWTADPEDPLQTLEDELEDLVDGVGNENSPAALAIMCAMSGIGEDWVRAGARQHVEHLVQRGMKPPAWYSDSTIEFVDAYEVLDFFGDTHAVAVAFSRGAASYTMLFFVESTLGVGGIELFDTPDTGVRGLLQDMVSATDGAFRSEITQLTPDAVWARVWPALEEFLEDEPDDEARTALLEQDEVEHPVLNVGLAIGWISSLEPDELPPTSVDPVDVDSVVSEFASYASSLPDTDAVRRFASVAVAAAVEDERSPYAYGPMSLTALLVGDFAASMHISPSDQALFGDLARSWAYFTSERQGLPADEARRRWDEILPDAMADFADACADPSLAEHRTGSFRD